MRNLISLGVLMPLVLLNARFCFSLELTNSPPIFIAHAAGAVNTQVYTNSLEALNENYKKGFKFFEIDFSWTSDGQLVAIHDWNDFLSGNFLVPEEIEVPTLEQFFQLVARGGFTQVSLRQVLRWAADKGDVRIVTDIKEDNIKALREIQRENKEFNKYVVPQVYSFREYDQAKAIGFRDVILTLYRMKVSPFELADFAEKKTPFAVTMHWQIAQSGLAEYLREKQTLVYAHTVNDEELFSTLREKGVYGIYTDHISPH